MDGEIRVNIEDAIATVTISRPQKLNSVTYEMLVFFEDRVARLLNDKDVFAVVFTGEGDRAFSAGFDLEMVRSLRGQRHYDFFKILEQVIRTVRLARNTITVAAVNGYAIGFGAMLASACDFRFFSTNASFRLPELDVGVFPGAGAASNLLALVGPSRTKDILLTGRTILAEEALRIGIADRVVPLAELMSSVREFLSSLYRKNHRLIMSTKTLIDGMTGERLLDAAEMESAYLEEWLREHNPEGT